MVRLWGRAGEMLRPGSNILKLDPLWAMGKIIPRCEGTLLATQLPPIFTTGCEIDFVPISGGQELSSEN